MVEAVVTVDGAVVEATDEETALIVSWCDFAFRVKIKNFIEKNK
jgi:hypothetical protein